MADLPEATVSVSTCDGVDARLCPDEKRVLRMAQLVFEGQGRSCASVGVVFADHDTVLALNTTWLEHDWHTDVISFLLEDDPVEGEIYIDVETAVERHAEFGATVQQEVERYAVHGMLHLCGLDDATPEQRDAMRVLEDRYLALLDD